MNLSDEQLKLRHKNRKRNEKGVFVCGVASPEWEELKLRCAELGITQAKMILKMWKYCKNKRPFNLKE